MIAHIQAMLLILAAISLWIAAPLLAGLLSGAFTIALTIGGILLVGAAIKEFNETKE